MSEKNVEVPKPIRVVVVDDHQVVRDGLRMMLEIVGQGFAIVGEASDGSGALTVIEQSQPEVVLMDIRMPGMDGIEAIRQIHRNWPQIVILILTTYNEDELMLAGLQNGARGYLLKETNRQTLFEAIRCAARGETLLPAEILARLVAYTPVTDASFISGAKTGETEASGTGISNDRFNLTSRERAILTGIARGERSKEIAHQLGITTHTVAAHLTHIYNKLGVDSRAAAVSVALRQGLISANTTDSNK